MADCHATGKVADCHAVLGLEAKWRTVTLLWGWRQCRGPSRRPWAGGTVAPTDAALGLEAKWWNVTPP